MLDNCFTRTELEAQLQDRDNSSSCIDEYFQLKKENVSKTNTPIN